MNVNLASVTTGSFNENVNKLNSNIDNKSVSNSQDKDSKFSSLVNKASENKAESSSKKVKSSSEIEVSDNKNSKENSKVDEKNDISKIEKYLKKAGFTDKQIEKIKDDIKSGKIDISSVFSMLSLLFSSNSDIQVKSNDFLSKLTEEIIEKISTDNSSKTDSTQAILNVVNSAVDKKLGFLEELLDDTDKSSKFIKQLSSKISDNIVSKLKSADLQSSGETTVNIQDLKSKIYSDLVSKLSSGSNDNTDNTLVQNNLTNVQKVLSFRQNVQSDNLANQDLSNQDLGNQDSKENNSGSFLSDKDNKILSNIASGEKSGDKISKAVNFMTQLNRINGDSKVGVAKLQSINQNTFNEDIIKTIKYMETNNIKDLTVKITPKELGDVTINLTMEDGKMKAVLTASNKNAYNIINSNLQDLSNKINNNDIKVQNFSLNLYQEDTTFFKDESERGQYREEKRRSNHTKIDSIQQDEIPISNSEYYSENNINMLA